VRKLGLIAGGGDLPIGLARHCEQTGRPFFVLRIKGFATSELERFDGVAIGLAELGRGIRALREAACEAVCFAGRVDRPNLATLKPDARGLLALPGAIQAASHGDGALLNFLLRQFEAEGFAVEGAHEVRGDLVLPDGPLGRREPAVGHAGDIGRAIEAARAVGRLDAGQGAVCCGGLILALEAQEGTDAMLERVALLRPEIRGSRDARRGVLAKVCKPDQETRVDMPTIGPSTVRHAADAGLAGIVGETGRLLVLARDETVALADELGLFVCGVSEPL